MNNVSPSPSHTPSPEMDDQFDASLDDILLDEAADLNDLPDFDLYQEADDNVPKDDTPQDRLVVPYSMAADGEILNYYIPQDDASAPVLPTVLKDKVDRKGNINTTTCAAPYAWIKRSLLVLQKDEQGMYSVNGDTPPEMLSEIEGIADDRRHVIARLSAEDLKDCEALTRLGLSGDAKELKALVRGQLMGGQVEKVLIVREKGWVNVEGELQYIYGANAVDPKGNPVDPDVRASDRVKASGSCGQHDHDIMRKLIETQPQQAFLLGFAASAPGISRVGDAEPGIINIYGDSSKGKTTTLEVIASLIGRATAPRDSGSYIKSWRTTDNGLEVPMSDHNDAPLLLDELHAAPVRMDWQSTAYMLANGRGKQRMTRDGLEADVASWCTQVISTGEVSMSEKVRAAAKGELAGGLQFRIIDLYAGSIELFKLGYADKDEWSDLLGKSITTSRDLAEALESHFANNYGHAWDEIVINMASDNFEGFASDYQRHRQKILMALPADASPVVQRRTKHIAAALAGLEQLHKIYNFDPQVFLDVHEFAMKHIIGAGLEGLSTTESQGIEESIAAAVFANADKISSKDDPAKNTGSEGAIGWKEKDDTLCFPTRTGWQRLCRSVGIDPDRARDAMLAKGWEKDRKRAPHSSGKVMCMIMPAEAAAKCEGFDMEDVHID